MRTTHQSDSAAGNGDGAARRSPHAAGTPAHSGREEADGLSLKSLMVALVSVFGRARCSYMIPTMSFHR